MLWQIYSSTVAQLLVTQVLEPNPEQRSKVSQVA